MYNGDVNSVNGGNNTQWNKKSAEQPEDTAAVTQNSSKTPKISAKELVKTDKASIFKNLDVNGDSKISEEELIEAGYEGDDITFLKSSFFKIFNIEVTPKKAAQNTYFKYNKEAEEYYKNHPEAVSSYDKIPQRNSYGSRDARACDISKLNLTKEQLLDLCIDKTTVMSDEQKAIVDEYTEKCKNPGLGIKSLHEQGITGKGVKMAMIDQPLGEHEEYSTNISYHEDINCKDMGIDWQMASMHGAAVASIAVGKNVGVAPDADLTYFSAVNATEDQKEVEKYKAKVRKDLEKNPDKTWLEDALQDAEQKGKCPDNTPYAEAINKVLDLNKSKKDSEKISVISISWGFDENAPGFEELQKAVKRAKKEGVFIVSTALNRQYGYKTNGANRNPQGNFETSEDYEAGAFWKTKSETVSNNTDKDKFLLIPMDHRTVADFTNGTSYRYEGNDGGMSWSTPWLAGMYALAKQVDPEITPKKFWKTALKTSDPCTNNDTGTYVGRLINPQKLIDELKK